MITNVSKKSLSIQQSFTCHKALESTNNIVYFTDLRAYIANYSQILVGAPNIHQRNYYWHKNPAHSWGILISIVLSITRQDSSRNSNIILYLLLNVTSSFNFLWYDIILILPLLYCWDRFKKRKERNTK